MRVRVAFGTSLPMGPLQNCWILLPETLKCVSDAAYHILDTFHLRSLCPHGLWLQVDGFTLPPRERISILRDGDVISVQPDEEKNGVSLWAERQPTKRRKVEEESSESSSGESNLEKQSQSAKSSDSGTSSSESSSDSEKSSESSSSSSESSSDTEKPSESSVHELKSEEDMAEAQNSIPVMGHIHFDGKGTPSPTKEKIVSPKPKPKPKPAPPRNYEAVAKLNRGIMVGDVLAYKVVELTDQWRPEVSEYKEGTVLACDGTTVTLEQQYPPPPPRHTGEKEEEEGDEVEEGPTRYASSSLLEVRLIKSGRPREEEKKEEKEKETNEQDTPRKKKTRRGGRRRSQRGRMSGGRVDPQHETASPFTFTEHRM